MFNIPMLIVRRALENIVVFDDDKGTFKREIKDTIFRRVVEHIASTCIEEDSLLIKFYALNKSNNGLVLLDRLVVSDLEDLTEDFDMCSGERYRVKLTFVTKEGNLEEHLEVYF